MTLGQSTLIHCIRVFERISQAPIDIWMRRSALHAMSTLSGLTYISGVPRSSRPVLICAPDHRDERAVAWLAGLVLFAKRSAILDMERILISVPASSLYRIPPGLVANPLWGKEGGRGEVELCIDKAAFLIRLISGADGVVMDGVPHRYLIARRQVVVTFLLGALASAPLQPSSDGWRVTCPTSGRALALGGVFRRCGLASRSSSRTGGCVLRVPKTEREALAALGAEVAPTLPRSFTGSSGQVTLDQINSDRRLLQETRTRWALEILGDSCPSHLREVAELRLRFPDASVERLGEMMSPQVSRHAVNGKLRRLYRLAVQFGNPPLS